MLWTRDYGHGRGSAQVNVEWDSVDINRSGQIEQVNRFERHTGQDLQRFPVHLLQYPLEFHVSFHRFRDVTPVKNWIVLLEVSPIQLS